MSTQYGTVAVNFAFGGTSTGLTSSSFSGYLIQSLDVTNGADVYPIKNEDGVTVNRTFTDFQFDATLEYVPTGASTTAARTATLLKTPGTVVSITACASRPDLIKSYWQVEPGTKVSGGNTGSAMISVPLKAFSGMSSVTGALS